MRCGGYVDNLKAAHQVAVRRMGMGVTRAEFDSGLC